MTDLRAAERSGGPALRGRAVGIALRISRAAATLTAVYAIGQVLGPLLVVPVVGRSFATAFTVAAVVIAISAILAFAAARARRAAR
ncbi:hypothetical protein [Nocardia rhamnosiphila]